MIEINNNKYKIQQDGSKYTLVKVAQYQKGTEDIKIMQHATLGQIQKRLAKDNRVSEFEVSQMISGLNL